MENTPQTIVAFPPTHIIFCSQGLTEEIKRAHYLN